MKNIIRFIKSYLTIMTLNMSIGNNQIECWVDIFLFDFWKYLEDKKSYVGLKRSANELYKHYSKSYLSKVGGEQK